MSAVTTHVLDTAAGRPAAGIAVRLEGPAGLLGISVTDDDGRVRSLGPDTLAAGRYRLVFDTDGYFDGPSFFPEVAVTFTVTEGAEHYHVPILLSPFAFSTYRGS
ncbi:MAG TPA: hydroxyisourate hydrolase [Pseudonocardiaceae bacterium]|jgi:5-hydroxyisourate hydrolase|nr:hydroxyisourate hydrolase [Pseudonocardiaceae bacterium]